MGLIAGYEDAPREIEANKIVDFYCRGSNEFSAGLPPGVRGPGEGRGGGGSRLSHKLPTEVSKSC